MWKSESWLSPVLLGAVGLLSAGACTSSSAEMSNGEKVYSQPLEGGNSFACMTCHALSEPAIDGFSRPGHAIGDAPRRTSFKGGQLNSFLEATNSCLTEWMNVEPWTEEDSQFVALMDYLNEEGSELPVLAVEIQIVQPPEEAELLGGDIESGRTHFNSSCAICHGEDGLGVDTDKAPRISGLGLAPKLIAERARLSGQKESGIYEGLTGGRMPFWGANRLSDEELVDIVAFLSQSEAPDAPDVPMDGAGGSGPGTPPASAPPVSLPPLRDCAATHSSVGKVATLKAFAHQVGGTVTVVDDCTLEFTDFVFDGQGVKVEFYGGLNDDYANGFSMSEGLRRDEGYAGSNFELRARDNIS